MTILQQIHAWSKQLPAWQQDAIARLYANRMLSAADLDDLYALAKVEVGIPDPHGRVPKVLDDAGLAPAANVALSIVLTGLHGVNNVNALKPGAELPISEKGITVIYGENGAGKSGFSRVFKKACRARDRREAILPNANIPSGQSGPATAVFNVIIDGQGAELAWQDGIAPPPELAHVSIFDSYCARAYVDNQGDFAYAPYGLDILEGLVGACGQLKARALQEKAAYAPSDAAYAALSIGATRVAQALRGVPKTTTGKDIEGLAHFDAAAIERLALLNRTLAEADPRQTATTLRQRAGRFDVLQRRIRAVLPELSAEKVVALEQAVARSNAAKAAAELAATQFVAVPDQLRGTGNDQWKALFEAARVFVRDGDATLDMANLGPEDACPLCQNKLGQEGAARLLRFDNFIQAAAERAAVNARAEAAVLYRQFQEANLDLHYTQPLAEELIAASPRIGEACTQLEAALTARRAAVMSAAAGRTAWEGIPALPTDITHDLAAQVEALQAEAAALEATADEALKLAMTNERAELDAVRRLVDVKDAVLEALTRHALGEKLQRCADSMAAGSISRKSTELSRTIASEELAAALNLELERLNVQALQVVMKPESPGGKTQFKLALQLPGGGTPSTILSEGEQRAIALASFLAEVQLGKSSGAVVLDDPVSSLDHRRRWEVAHRLVHESLTRQVVIFTHDIYFLLILEQKAKEAGAALSKTYIRRTEDGYGSPSQDLPFDVLGTNARVGRLRELLVLVAKALKSGDEDGHRALTSRFYHQLRLAWERCIEEVLLNGAVVRFGEGVHTQALKNVTVTDEDYAKIEAGMSKASKFEHDAASAVGRLPVPNPNELQGDLDQLAAWAGAIRERMNKLSSKKITRKEISAG